MEKLEMRFIDQLFQIIDTNFNSFVRFNLFWFKKFLKLSLFIKIDFLNSGFWGYKFCYDNGILVLFKLKFYDFKTDQKLIFLNYIFSLY